MPPDQLTVNPVLVTPLDLKEFGALGFVSTLNGEEDVLSPENRAVTITV